MLGNKHKLAQAIRLAVAIPASVALSAVAPAVMAEENEIDEIVVTGSFIPRKDLSGPSPVAVFDRSAIEYSGATSIGQMLREIPSISGAGQTTSINNGGTGSQNISLRGLEAGRTLVLFNGRRAPDSSGGNSGLVDLNTIPVSMVEKVEVLKDGASAIYGSDAIAGVVNIILRNDFEGVAVTAQTGRSAEDDGEKREYSFTFGNQFDGGNFVLSFTRVEEDDGRYYFAGIRTTF